MKIPLDKYEVGYGRPPKKTRWKKGQCGNPLRKRKQAPKTVVQMVDDFFAGKIDIIEKGITQRVSNFEAIILQLWIKATDGNKRAMKVFLKFQEFAASRGGTDGARFEFVITDAKEDEAEGKNG